MSSLTLWSPGPWLHSVDPLMPQHPSPARGQRLLQNRGLYGYTGKLLGVSVLGFKAVKAFLDVGLEASPLLLAVRGCGWCR